MSHSCPSTPLRPTTTTPVVHGAITTTTAAQATAVLGIGSSYMVRTGGNSICYTMNHFTEDDVRTRYCFSFSTVCHGSL